MGGGLGGAHWHEGQGERGRRGGEGGQGLSDRDPEVEAVGRVTTDRGDIRPEVGSCAVKDSPLGEAVTGGDILPRAEVEVVTELGRGESGT